MSASGSGSEPEVTSEPLEDEDGNTYVIAQQNQGAAETTEGGGEFPDPDTPPRPPAPGGRLDGPRARAADPRPPPVRSPDIGTPTTRRRLFLSLLVAAFLAGLTACGSPHQAADVDPSATTLPSAATTVAPSIRTPTTTSDPHRSLVATVTGSSIDIFDQPDQPQRSRTMPSPRPSGQEQAFLVLEERGDWLSVLLPVRPNGTTGWIRAADVDLTTHEYRILVELDDHLITVTNGEEVVHQEPVGVGRGRTPTPGGLFYTVELYKSLKPAYGPFAYGLSGYSEVLYDFAGGDGQFGIHGTSEAGGLGSDVSNGCIRMSNAGITRLAGMLPIGVPVEVRA